MSLRIGCQSRFVGLAVLVAAVGACSSGTPARPGAGGGAGQGNTGGAGGTKGVAGVSSGEGTTGMGGSTAAAGAIGMGATGVGASGVGGTTGLGGRTGLGGTTGAGGAFGTAGSPGAAGGGAAGLAGNGGTGGNGGAASCGALGQMCCSSPPDSCEADLTCLSGASCSCAKGVGGQYVLRTDGVILAPDSATWIIDGQTTSPVTRMTNVSSGISHGCSSDDSGSAWCWQTDKTGNSAGQLGNGTNVDSGLLNRATKVLKAANSPLTGVVGLADYCIDHYSGFDASCAVTGQGQLHCWGNLSWIVNGGVLLTSSYAEAITMDGLNPLTGVLQASIGEGRSACVVVQGTPSNTVYCWGHNGSYNLGQGDTTNRQYPTKVNGLSAPTKVVIAADDNGGVGSTTTCAIDGGQVLCWGYNGSLGDCGVNTTVATVTIPTRVKIQSGAVLDNIVDLEGEGDPGYGNGGGGNFCALRSDGSMWCWGRFYKPYAANYGITNITAVGNVFDTPRYLTSDGIYHVGSGKTEALNCGTLQ